MRRLQVWVQPKSRRPGLVKSHGGGLRISVSAAPEKGRANEEVLAVLAETLGVPESRLRIASGAASRHKWVEIPDAALIQISVRQISGGDSGVYDVEVREKDTQTKHRVTMKGGTPQAVEAAFRFLLDREPKESILKTFDVSVISKYFPEFDSRKLL